MPRNNRLIDISGQRFGALEALYRADRMAGNGGAMWHCCGREEDISGHDLRRGRITQCGDCRRRERRNRMRAPAAESGASP